MAFSGADHPRHDTHGLLGQENGLSAGRITLCTKAFLSLLMIFSAHFITSVSAAPSGWGSTIRLFPLPGDTHEYKQNPKPNAIEHPPGTRPASWKQGHSDWTAPTAESGAFTGTFEAAEGIDSIMLPEDFMTFLAGDKSTEAKQDDVCSQLLNPVTPCECTSAGVICSAVTSETELMTIPGFHNGQSLPFMAFVVENNPDLEELPDNAFGLHSAIYYIFNSNSKLTRIAPTVFQRGSPTRLIEVTKNPQLQSFPFEILPQYPSLDQIYIQGGYLIEIPAGSFDHAPESLRVVSLAENNIVWIEPKALAGLPTGTYLNLEGNPLPVVGRNSLHFKNRLEAVSLRDSGTGKFEPGFTGGGALPQSLLLGGASSALKNLAQDAWEPVLQQILDEFKAQGTETAISVDHPLACDCSMKWLHDRPEFSACFQAGRLSCYISTVSLWDMGDSDFANC